MKGWNYQRKTRFDPNRGANAKRDRRLLKFLTSIKTWQLVLLFVLSVMVSVICLRLNNLGALDRYDALRKADKTGNVVSVETAAKELQSYVTKHMNSTVPRVALQTLYEQAAQAALDAAKPEDIDNTLYQRVTEECASAWYSGGSRARARCISEKIGASGASGFDEAESISPDAYYVEYASARWSFDAAGISLLITIALAAIIILRIIIMVILRVVLRFKYRSA